jgi:hypothetical protein
MIIRIKWVCFCDFIHIVDILASSMPLPASANPSLFPNRPGKDTLGIDMASARAFSTGNACAHN